MMYRKHANWDRTATDPVAASHLIYREGKDQNELYRVCDGMEIGGSGQWGTYGRQYFLSPMLDQDVLPVTDYIDDDIQCAACQDVIAFDSTFHYNLWELGLLEDDDES